MICNSHSGLEARCSLYVEEYGHPIKLGSSIMLGPRRSGTWLQGGGGDITWSTCPMGQFELRFHVVEYIDQPARGSLFFYPDREPSWLGCHRVGLVEQVC